MALITGRAKTTAEVIIDHSHCTGCGLCIEVCKGQPLYWEDDTVHVDQSRYFGCIGCGHCAAICPVNCITVQGREISPQDFFDIPPVETRADYEQQKALMLSRRSIREFAYREVEQEVIDKVIAAAATAPAGIPPSDVEILVFKGRHKVRRFSRDIITEMRKSKWMFSPFIAAMMRPFVGKETHEMFTSFLFPLIQFLDEKDRQVEDWLFYNAPLAMYFYASAYSDPADPLIAATYAMLAAESLGLGSCMIGSAGPFIQYNKNLKRKYKLPPKIQPGMVLIMGYPAVKYQWAIKRTLAAVKYY